MKDRYGSEQDDNPGLSVAVVGVGGGGNNSINRLSRIGVYGAQTIAVNTDKNHLQNIQAETKMLIGKDKNRGLGAGGNPAVGEECAQSAHGGFRQVLGESDLVFVIAGMGGGTGTGAAPVITEIARRQGAMVIAISTMPFSVEGKRRRKVGKQGIMRIREYANSTIVLENDKLLDVVPDMPMDQAFGVMDSLIAELVKSLTETVTYPSLINLDFNDLRTVLGCGGISTLLRGEAPSDEPEKAVEEASSNPFLSKDYTGADKALIHVTGGPDFTISKMNKVVGMMTSRLGEDANVIFGARVDPHCKNKIKLMSVVTGLGEGKKKSKKPNMKKKISKVV